MGRVRVRVVVVRVRVTHLFTSHHCSPWRDYIVMSSKPPALNEDSQGRPLHQQLTVSFTSGGEKSQTSNR